MINLDDNNQPVSPEIGKIRIKDFSDMSYTADDDKDFHIRTVRDETLIDSAGELDDSHEFALNMFDRGAAPPATHPAARPGRTPRRALRRPGL